VPENNWSFDEMLSASSNSLKGTLLKVLGGGGQVIMTNGAEYINL